MGIRIARSRSRAALLAVTSAVAIMGNSASVAAHHDLFRRVSVGALGGNGAFSVTFAGASTDGKRVFFTSAEQLTSNDTDSQTDVFERSAGSTKAVSRGEISDGNGPFNATFAGASADGSRVFFQTSEALGSDDGDSAIDVFERIAAQGITRRVSQGQINGSGTQPATFAGSSADGNRVWFHTIEKLVAGDTEIAKDVYERSGGTTTLVSAGQINGNGVLDATFAGASASGQRVWFTTTEKLAPADIDTATDIYERSGGETYLVSRGTINGNGNFNAAFRGASNDGSRVFFTTLEQLASGDTDSQEDIYAFSAGVIQRISVGAINSNGAQPASFVGSSSDGSRVFFETTEQLVSADTDSSVDIYQRLAGVTTLISTAQMNGNGPMNAGFRGASADGSHVFFVTTEKLIGSDTDAQLDVYERFAGLTTQASLGRINGNGAFSAQFLGASADGVRVFFATTEQLVSDDDDANTDVYERSDQLTTYVVSIGDGAFAATFRKCSADGTAVFFTTSEKVLPTDKDAVTDIYGAYDADV